MQERVVRQIRMLRAMRRELETELRILLLGHEGGNPRHGQGDAYGFLRQLSTLPGSCRRAPHGRRAVAYTDHVLPPFWSSGYLRLCTARRMQGGFS